MAEREWFDTDYYKVLGVTSTATAAEITKAYRKLAKQHHPDTNPGSEARFKEITAANDVVGDPDKRKEYDEVRRLGPAAAGFGGQQQGNPFGTQGNANDIFSNLFGGSQRRPRAQRGSDVETALHLNFRDAVFGLETTVPLPTNENCRACGGRGGAPGGGFVTCPTCHGQGMVNADQGLFSMSQACPTCHGRGGRVVTPCASCQGTGREMSSRRIKVRIPSGVEDGQRIKLTGKGEPGRGGGPAGDLLVDIHVASDPHFARRGQHLTTKVSVSATQAMLGTTVEIPTMDEPVNLKIPSGTQPGTTMRVRGRGIPASKKNAHGDLLVTVNVTLPKKLTKEQRTLVEKLASTLKETVES